MSLEEYLKKWNIPGAQGIDTRALTRHLRTRGAMKACLTTEEISPEEATQEAIKGEGVIGMDYVREVHARELYQWDPEDKLSEPWSIGSSNGGIKPSLPPVRSSHRRLRLWDQGEYSAASAAERFRRHGCASNHNCRRSARAKSGWRFSFQWTRRSRGARLTRTRHRAI